MEKQNSNIPNSSGRDSIVRIAVRLGTGGWATIRVRDSGVPSAPRCYELHINPGLGTVELKGANTGLWRMRKKWPLVRAADAGEWMQVELRTVGEEFTVSIDGQRLEPVRDTTLMKFITDYRDDFPTTAPVGACAANAHGLFDLAGNVSEWCEDWNDDDHKQRVLRSSWLAGGVGGRSGHFVSARLPAAPSLRGHEIGFRVILAPVAAGR